MPETNTAQKGNFKAKKEGIRSIAQIDEEYDEIAKFCRESEQLAQEMRDLKKAQKEAEDNAFYAQFVNAFQARGDTVDFAIQKIRDITKDWRDGINY